jgi:hypothetical protein
MMKTILLLVLIFSVAHLSAQTGSVGIGTTTPHASAVLDIQNSTKGILIPRMTTVQRNAISNPAAGLLVFDNNTQSFWFRGANNWIELVDTANNIWKRNGSNIIASGTGNVGIGVANPSNKLEVDGNLILGTGTNQFGLLRRPGGIDLSVNSGMGNTINSTPAGNLVMQTDQPPFFTAGNVGIGKTDPAQKLAVNGTVGLYNGANQFGALGNEGNKFLVNAKLGNTSTSTPAEDLVLQYENSPLSTSGRVGIGTATPSQKLDVNGSVNVSGNLVLGGGLTTAGAVNVGTEINRSNSGTTDLLPKAFGRVRADGFITGGTGNFTVTKVGTGRYNLQLTGTSGSFLIMSPFGDEVYLRTLTYRFSGSTMEIFTYRHENVYDSNNNLYLVRPQLHDLGFDFVVFGF